MCALPDGHDPGHGQHAGDAGAGYRHPCLDDRQRAQYQFTVNGSAGTPDQNTYLANKIVRGAKGQMAAFMTQEIRRQMRPGGLIANGRR